MVSPDSGPNSAMEPSHSVVSMLQRLWVPQDRTAFRRSDDGKSSSPYRIVDPCMTAVRLYMFILLNNLTDEEHIRLGGEVVRDKAAAADFIVLVTSFATALIVAHCADPIYITASRPLRPISSYLMQCSVSVVPNRFGAWHA